MCVCASVLAGVREGLDPVKMDLQVVECCPVGARSGAWDLCKNKCSYLRLLSNPPFSFI